MDRGGDNWVRETDEELQDENIVSAKAAAMTTEQYIEQNVCRNQGHRFGVICTPSGGSYAGGGIYAMCELCGKVIAVLSLPTKSV